MKDSQEYIEQLAYAVIGAAIEVHWVLGPGFLEEVYHKALRQEFLIRGIPHKYKHPIVITYKGYPVGEKELDFLVGESLVVELKAVQNFTPIHDAQVMSYLKITKHHLALMINFNVLLLKDGIKRIILWLILLFDALPFGSGVFSLLFVIFD